MVLWARTQDEPYIPDFLPGEWCVIVHNSENRENDGEVFVNLFYYFQICVIQRN